MEVLEKIIGEIFGLVLIAVKGLFTQGIPFIFKFINIILWAMVGAIILPMVFVSGNLYPVWEKWAENLKK